MMKKNSRNLRMARQATLLVCSAAISGSLLANTPTWASARAAHPLTNVPTQQQGILSGKVTDKDGKPLVGASVRIVGTILSTATDANGAFSLQLAAGTDTAEASYIAYKPLQQEGVVVAPNGNTPLQLALEETFGELDEVVVIGYGQNVRRNLTTAVSSVKPADIPDRNVASANQILQGQVAGVNLTTSNGTPGGNSRVSIRGVSSINGDNEPLYVIDGIPLSKATASYNFSGEYRQDPLSLINPSDIESIDVLKDAAATAI